MSLPRVPPPAAERPNQRQSMDFVADRLADGRRFRFLTFGDNMSRVSPALEADLSLTGEQVVVVLDSLKVNYGLPETISADNGSECISRALDAWAHHNWSVARVVSPWRANRRPVHRVVQRALPGGVPRSALVRGPGRGPAGHRGVPRRVQSRAPHSAPGYRIPSEFRGAWESLAKAGDESLSWTTSGCRSERHLSPPRWHRHAGASARLGAASVLW